MQAVISTCIAGQLYTSVLDCLCVYFTDQAIIMTKRVIMHHQEYINGEYATPNRGCQYGVMAKDDVRRRSRLVHGEL